MTFSRFRNLLLFAAILTGVAANEDWRNYVLDEEACLEDTQGRFTQCDFEGFSNQELQTLLKQVLEERTIRPKECQMPKQKGGKVQQQVMAMKPKSKKKEADPTCAKIIDGMDVSIPNTGIRMIFGTPIFIANMPHNKELNKYIVNLLHTMERNGAGTKQTKSSKGDGFRTDDTFLQMQTPQIKELYGHLLRFGQHVFQFGRKQQFSANLELRGWANILRKGSHHTSHVHPQAVWSGVYYAKVPKGVGDLNAKYDDQSQGCLVLVDPRPGIQMTTVSNQDMQFVEKMEVCPAEGMVVMFPAWMSHYVPYVEVEGDRVAVAFNVHAVAV